MDESIKILRKRFWRLGSNIQTTTGDVTYTFQIEVTSLQTGMRRTHALSNLMYVHTSAHSRGV